MTARFSLQQLMDEREIEQLLYRYCTAIDRPDKEMLDSCFHPDAILHYPRYSEADGNYIEWVYANGARLKGQAHYLSNVRIEVEDSVAQAESYLFAYHWGEPKGDPSVNFGGGSRYIDRLTSRGSLENRRTCRYPLYSERHNGTIVSLRLIASRRVSPLALIAVSVSDDIAIVGSRSDDGGKNGNIS